MRLDEARFADVVVLGPIGRVDHVTAEELKTALAPHLARCGPGHDHVVLDFAGVDYISSAGLRVMLVLARRLRDANGQLGLCAMGDAVRQVFQLAGFLPLFVVGDSRAAVVQQIAGS